MAAWALENLSLLGVSHAQASVEAREQLSIAHDEANGFIAALRARGAAEEAVVLSTCNRTEVYCVGTRPMEIADLEAAYGNDAIKQHASMLYHKQGRDAIKHAFEVACGLDSMILGEPEILGQMKQAYAEARQAGFAGPGMSLLFERAFRVAKTVRTETSIARESVSAAALCAKLAKEIFGQISDCAVLCVGGGTIIKSALAHLHSNTPAKIAVANRTPEHITEMAKESGAQVIPFDQLGEQLPNYDIVIAATAAPQSIISKRDLEQACAARKRKPIAVFDLAVPRDIEPDSRELEDVYLYTIDDIGAMTNASLDKRRRAANEAQQYIAQATEEMVERIVSNGRAPAVAELKSRLQGIEERAAQRALKDLAAGKDPEQAIKELAQRLTSKLSHDSISTLADGSSPAATAKTISEWYQQDDE